jgi:hypothetical protein
MKLKIVVVGATNLRNADVFDHSDPYCKVAVQGEHHSTFQTAVVDNSLNPVWNHVEVVEWDGVGDVVFQVLDKDTFSDDDPLGQAIIPAKIVARGFDGKVLIEPAVFADSTGPGIALHWRLFGGASGGFAMNGQGRIKQIANGAELHVRLIPEGGPVCTCTVM